MMNKLHILTTLALLGIVMGLVLVVVRVIHD
jgi:hypothetical protein